MTRRRSKHLDHTSLAEDIYWHRILPRAIKKSAGCPLGAEQVQLAWARAQAVAIKYKRLKKASKKPQIITEATK